MNENESVIFTQNEQRVFDHGYAEVNPSKMSAAVSNRITMGKAEAYEKAFHLLVDTFGQARDNQFLSSLLQREEKMHDPD